jgi:hypothetical protein
MGTWPDQMSAWIPPEIAASFEKRLIEWDSSKANGAVLPVTCASILSNRVRGLNEAPRLF